MDFDGLVESLPRAAPTVRSVLRYHLAAITRARFQLTVGDGSLDFEAVVLPTIQAISSMSRSADELFAAIAAAKFNFHWLVRLSETM